MTDRKTVDAIAVEPGPGRLSRSERHELRHQALLRYRKHRQRNQLASPGVHDLILVLDSLKAGFNVAKIFRTAEFMGVHEVHLVNIGPFDPAPSKGGFRKVPARFFGDYEACYTDLSRRGYALYALQPAGDCPHLGASPLPRRSAFILGHEEFGTTFDRTRFPDIGCLTIPSFGSTESLNVSVAASIVTYEYVRQHAQVHKADTET